MHLSASPPHPCHLTSPRRHLTSRAPATGPAELLLKESLRGDGFALNSAEKKEIADMYRNPGFTVRVSTGK